ncbi:MAG: SMC-Scp complex subunit ScpB [Planctomycetes bacterium]|nr:SMC-Scp complex subunit ScpB [Planctomycetota bacterium]
MVEKSQSPAGGNGSAGSNGHAAENEANDEALRAELGASEDAEGVVDVPSGADELADVELSPASPALDDATVERAVAALLFAANEPLSAGRLASLIGGVDATRVEAALVGCGERLRASGLPFDLRAIAGGWQLFTSTDQDAVVTRLARVKKDEKVSPASLETLSIIAYRQPVTKAEIEAIRGVQVGPILRALVDRAFVRVAGRAEVPGHPLLYGTTKKFLDTFGLASLEELPRDAELVRD